MPAIDVQNLTAQMVNAAKGVLGANWQVTKTYAEAEFNKLALTLDFIRQEVLAGRMTPAKAQIHLEMQKNAATTVLLTIKGLNVLAVENAINAALGVVKNTVNTAVGFVLL